jgi:2-polyprenyl-3-methyl-5-hydroxy-6-metoxy-1,4-benzoquinol methylase
MASKDRVRWDSTYKDYASDPYPPPTPLLLQFTPPAPDDQARPYRALDIAAGRGQNGLWLAEQGYTVDLMDISREGLLQAQAEAGRRGLRGLNFLQTDLEHVSLKPETYDVICVIRYLNRDLFAQIRASVRPGGRVLYETFNRRYENVHKVFNKDYLLEIGELPGYFADWKIIHQHEPGHVSQVVAIKPRHP